MMLSRDTLFSIKNKAVWKSKSKGLQEDSFFQWAKTENKKPSNDMGN